MQYSNLHQYVFSQCIINFMFGKKDQKVIKKGKITFFI